MSFPNQRRLVLVCVIIALVVVLGGVLLFRRSTMARPAARNETAEQSPAAATASAPSSAAAPVASSPSSSSPKIQATEFREQAEAARLLRNPAQRSLEFGRNLQAWVARDPGAASAYG